MDQRPRIYFGVRGPVIFLASDESKPASVPPEEVWERQALPLNCTSSGPRRFFSILPSDEIGFSTLGVSLPEEQAETRRRLVVLVKASDEGGREFIRIGAECVMRRNV